MLKKTTRDVMLAQQAERLDYFFLWLVNKMEIISCRRSVQCPARFEVRVSMLGGSTCVIASPTAWHARVFAVVTLWCVQIWGAIVIISSSVWCVCVCVWWERYLCGVCVCVCGVCVRVRACVRRGTWRSQLYKHVECCTTVLLWQIYVAGNNAN